MKIFCSTSQSNLVNHCSPLSYDFKFSIHYSRCQNSFLYTLFNSKNGSKINVSCSFSRKNSVSCKLETSETESGVRARKKKLQVPTKTKIAAPEPGGAPVVSDKGGGGSGRAPLKVPRGKKDGSWLLKGFSRKALAALSNLHLAMAEMFAVAALMALGTVIEQGEAPDFYFQK